MPSIHSYVYSMEETARYATLADNAMSGSDTVVLNGNNCGLRVINKALHVKQGSLLGADREPIIYYKGTVPVKTIVLMGKSGMISLEALRWCKEQSISLVMLDGIGNLFYSLSPEGESNAKLRRLQYQADITGMGGYIARELVRQKTVAQIEVLKTLPERKKQGETIAERIGKRTVLIDSVAGMLIKSIRELLEDGLEELPQIKEVRVMQTLEGRLADRYWSAFVGIPLRWTDRDTPLVPPHWRVITERPSTLSGSISGRRAICPFHAALNYLYGVAEHLLLCSIHAAGLDPSCGFLHYDKEHRVSLVYDLIEKHRAEIDAQVLRFFNRTTLQRGDVVMLPQGQIMLNKELCRYLIITCMPDAKKLESTVSWLVNVLTGQ